jgi:hypothetical protein
MVQEFKDDGVRQKMKQEMVTTGKTCKRKKNCIHRDQIGISTIVS